MSGAHICLHRSLSQCQHILLISTSIHPCVCYITTTDDLYIFQTAEAIRTTVVPIRGVIGPTIVRIANATGIGYRHDGSIRLSYKLTNALNY